MGKASIDWSGVRNAWIVKGGGGSETGELGNPWKPLNITVPSTGTIQAAAIADLKVGGGTSLTKIGIATGTLLPLTSVGTCKSAISTISGMSGITTGDKVFVTPKAALGGNNQIGVAYVPSTNTVNVWITNPDPASAGSLVAMGVDVTYITS